DYLSPTGSKSLVTQHRLQPFNPKYFRPGSELFSYSNENCQASAAAANDRIPPARFFNGPLAPPEEEWRQVTLDQLISFYRSPAKFFLRERLQLRLPNDKSPLEEREPFELGGLDAYQIQQDLMKRALEGEKLEELEILVRAGGQFPAGETGRLKFQ